MDLLIFVGSTVLEIAAMALMRWPINQISKTVVATVLFWACLIPLWDQIVPKTHPNDPLCLWISGIAIFGILFSGQNFLQKRGLAWGAACLTSSAILLTMIVMGIAEINLSSVIW
jgi:hypothetical protein